VFRMATFFTPSNYKEHHERIFEGW
jgi:hypothetical protein